MHRAFAVVFVVLFSAAFASADTVDLSGNILQLTGRVQSICGPLPYTGPNSSASGSIVTFDIAGNNTYTGAATGSGSSATVYLGRSNTYSGMATDIGSSGGSLTLNGINTLFNGWPVNDGSLTYGGTLTLIPISQTSGGRYSLIWKNDGSMTIDPGTGVPLPSAAWGGVVLLGILAAYKARKIAIPSSSSH
jgi:hypothetical protein